MVETLVDGLGAIETETKEGEVGWGGGAERERENLSYYFLINSFLILLIPSLGCIFVEWFI